MSESQAIPGPGFLISFEDPDSPGTWHKVTEVGDIDGPSQTRDTVEVTNQDSDGGYKEYKTTLKDGGTVTYPMNAVPGDTAQSKLDDLYENGDLTGWHIKEGDTGFYVHFKGLVTNLSRTYPVGNVMKRNVTIKVSGRVTENEVGS